MPNNRVLFNKQKKQFNELRLMGITDIAEALGWTASKTRIYIDRGILPKPIGEVGKRPVWLAIQIEPYLAEWRGRSGKNSGADQSQNERV